MIAENPQTGFALLRYKVRQHGPKCLLALLCWLAIYATAYAQETEYLEGVVKNRDSLTRDVYIRNLSKGLISTTNQKGVFKIKAEVGDTLIFSHVALKESVLFLQQGQLDHKPFVYEMDKNQIELDAVEITNTAKTDAISLRIVSEEPENLTQNERRLNAAGDFKWIHLLGLLGGHLEVDPILNKINGRTKRLKRYIKMDQKMENMHFLKSHYSDYMIKDLDVPETAISGFLYHLIEQENLQDLIDQKQADQLKFFIVDQWVQYEKLLHQEDD